MEITLPSFGLNNKITVRFFKNRGFHFNKWMSGSSNNMDENSGRIAHLLLLGTGSLRDLRIKTRERL
jgi:hypothetical protein